MNASSVFAGDNIIPDAVMIYDQSTTVKATAAECFPWLQQIGKDRGGWYLPGTYEQYLPTSWRASRNINSDWQKLKPGDRLEDYGFDAKEDFFIVDSIQQPDHIVLRSERYGCKFSWALILHESRLQPADDPRTVIHLRFRGRIEATGLKRWLIVRGGGFMDWISTAPMLAGLKERVESERARL